MYVYVLGGTGERMHTYTYVYTYICIYMYTCIYIYICMYILGGTGQRSRRAQQRSQPRRSGHAVGARHLPLTQVETCSIYRNVFCLHTINGLNFVAVGMLLAVACVCFTYKNVFYIQNVFYTQKCVLYTYQVLSGHATGARHFPFAQVEMCSIYI